MQVSDILEAKGDRVISVESESKISAVAATLRHERIGATVVKQGDGAMVGIISERDIVAGLAQHDEHALQLPVADLMTSAVVTCGPTDSIEALMEQMTSEGIRHLPVVEQGRLIGIVSIGDVVKSAMGELRARTRILQDQVVAAAGWSTDED